MKRPHPNYYKKYRRTIKGLLSKRYNALVHRVSGADKHTKISTKGVPLLPREEFYEWSLGQQHFHNLYEAWVDSNYDKVLTPTLIRHDTEKGYVIGNIEWVRLEEQWVLQVNKLNELIYG